MTLKIESEGEPKVTCEPRLTSFWPEPSIEISSWEGRPASRILLIKLAYLFSWELSTLEFLLNGLPECSSSCISFYLKSVFSIGELHSSYNSSSSPDSWKWKPESSSLSFFMIVRCFSSFYFLFFFTFFFIPLTICCFNNRRPAGFPSSKMSSAVTYSGSAATRGVPELTCDSGFPSSSVGGT